MKFMSQIEFYHNLYVSECWQKKKGKIVKRLKENKLQPQVYVITLSQGEQNQLEFFSSVLLKQSIFEHSKLFVIGIADGYAVCFCRFDCEDDTAGAEDDD